ncbi:MAG TPA: FHA domain-containing protein [Gemmataceae bacterium]|jgi:DNA-binding CsgD family transcriptional regulator|nr:FHA domain-containing protein [Gemmataceae bacterium]
MSTIFVLEGPSRSLAHDSFLLRDVVSLLGRSSDCDIVLESTKVSRRHAEIAVRGDVVCVTDLGSRNGTFVDEQPIQKARVEHGQRLRFGNMSFVLCEQLLRADGPHSDWETDECYSDEKADVIRARALALTEGQRRVYELLISGISDKQIALQLEVSPHTIHTHIRAIYKILEVHSRCELLACLLPPSEPRLHV